MTNRIATRAKVCCAFSEKDELFPVENCLPELCWLFLQEDLPADIQAQFLTSRELIKNIHNSFNRLRDRAEKMAERSKENATDLLMFGRELRYVKGWFWLREIVLMSLRFAAFSTDDGAVEMNCISLPNLCFFPPQRFGLRWFLSSILGLVSEHLGGSAAVSEESVCGVRRAVGQSCSAGNPPPHSSIPPPALL